MTVDVSTAIAVGSIIFAAGGLYYTVKRTSSSAFQQGKRLGKLEEKVALIQGMLRIRRATFPQGQPKTPEADGDS